MPRLGVLGRPQNDLNLHFRKMRQVAAHVVEEDREALHAHRIKGIELGLQIAPRIVVEGAIDLKGTQPDSEADAQRAAMRSKLSESLESRHGVEFAPTLA